MEFTVQISSQTKLRDPEAVRSVAEGIQRYLWRGLTNLGVAHPVVDVTVGPSYTELDCQCPLCEGDLYLYDEEIHPTHPSRAYAYASCEAANCDWFGEADFRLVNFRETAWGVPRYDRPGFVGYDGYTTLLRHQPYGVAEKVHGSMLDLDDAQTTLDEFTAGP